MKLFLKMRLDLRVLLFFPLIKYEQQAFHNAQCVVLFDAAHNVTVRLIFCLIRENPNIKNILIVKK